MLSADVIAKGIKKICSSIESSPSLAGSEDYANSELKQQDLNSTSALLSSSSATATASESCESDSKTCQFTMMSGSTTQSQEALTLSSAESHVNPSLMPESAEQKQTSAICSPNFSDSFAMFNPDGQLWKMSAGCLQQMIDGSFQEFSGNFPKSGCLVNGVLYQQPAWVQSTDASESSLLPTPTATDATAGQIIGENDTFIATKNGTLRRHLQTGNNCSLSLGRYVQMLPTPKAQDGEHPGVTAHKQGQTLHLSAAVNQEKGRKLNPVFVEKMQGFPEGWTELAGGNPPPSRFLTEITSSDTPTLKNGLPKRRTQKRSCTAKKDFKRWETQLYLIAPLLFGSAWRQLLALMFYEVAIASVLYLYLNRGDNDSGGSLRDHRSLEPKCFTESLDQAVQELEKREIAIAGSPGGSEFRKTYETIGEILPSESLVADAGEENILPETPAMDNSTIGGTVVAAQKSISALSLSEVATDGGTQSRLKLNDATIEDYAEAMRNGDDFPPVIVFYDGKTYWLADGFHRVAAARKAEIEDITVDIKQGTQREAILHSVGANAKHGLRRTNADKRNSVIRLLEDQEWGKWTDNEIAKHCGVSQPFVSKIHSEIDPSYNGYKIERTVTRGGKTYKMDASKIGKSKQSAVTDIPSEDNASLKEGDRILLKPSHHLAGSSGRITSLPNGETAIVEIEGKQGRETISRHHLQLVKDVQPTDLVVSPESSDKPLLPDVERSQGEMEAQPFPLLAAVVNEAAIAQSNNPVVIFTESVIGVLSNIDYGTDEQFDALLSAINAERQRRMRKRA